MSPKSVMRRLCLWACLLAGLFSVAGCGSAARPERPATQTAPSPEVSAGQLRLTLIHSNDTWGYVLPCG